MTEIITSHSYWAKIYIAGDYDLAKQICREYTMKGLCINISKVDYIYTMGEEAGICVELINYPVFSRNQADILEDAEQLAQLLLLRLCQASYTIMTPNKAYYVSRKKDIRDKNKTNEKVTPEGEIQND
jgi:hypothetical protein